MKTAVTLHIITALTAHFVIRVDIIIFIIFCKTGNRFFQLCKHLSDVKRGSVFIVCSGLLVDYMVWLFRTRLWDIYKKNKAEK